MGKINIKLNGMDTVVDAIRYFKDQDTNYFIYTLGELDNQAYQISYVTKVEDGKGQLLNNDEWEKIKELIKYIVRESKIAQDTIEDKSFQELEGIDVLYTKPFKLPMSSTNLLRVQNIVQEKVELEPENDVDPLLPKEYTFDSTKEVERKEENVELPKLEPSKTVDFEEFEEKNPIQNDFEVKLDINQFEEMPLSELPETDSFMNLEEMPQVEEIQKEEPVLEEQPIQPSLEKDQTIINLENMKTEVTKGTMDTPVVSKELANPTFTPIDPFKENHEKSQGLIRGIYNSLFDKEEKKETSKEEELKPIDLDSYEEPKKVESQPTLDYAQLEVEIAELRNQIAELTKKIG